MRSATKLLHLLPYHGEHLTMCRLVVLLKDIGPCFDFRLSSQSRLMFFLSCSDAKQRRCQEGEKSLHSLIAHCEAFHCKKTVNNW